MIDTNKDLSGLPDPDEDPQFYSGVPFKRLIAFFIDFIVVFGLSVAAIFATLGVVGFFFIPAMFLINIAYRIFFIGKNSATLGMQAAGIEIRNNEGEKLDYEAATWHTGTFILLFMFFITNVINIAMMLLNLRRQGLHDYLLGTAVINRPID